MPCNFNDNKDNRNNGKNGRNCGCHEVTYNRDNNDYCCQLVILALIKDQPVRLY